MSETIPVPGDSEPVVVARNLVKQFGKLYAVNKLSMTINAGQYDYQCR